MSSRWTPERDEQLRKLAADHLTADRIAAALGPDFTRNMVIGRAARIGVSLGAIRGPSAKPRVPQKRAPTRRATQEPTRRRKPSLAAVAARDAVAADPEPRLARVEPETPLTGPVTLMALRFPVSQCRWIDGETNGTATVFCGAPVRPGSSYCPEHRERCWAPYRRKAA